MEKDEFRTILEHWFLAALISLPIPIILSFIAQFFPRIAIPFNYDNYSPMVYRLPIHWFVGYPHMLVFLPSVTYWGLGLYSSVRIFNQKIEKKENLSKGLLSFSLGVLFFILPVLSATLCLALKGGLTSLWFWYEWQGNHGPLRNVPFLSNTLKTILFLPLAGFLISFISFILKRNKYTAIVCISSLFILYLFSALYWLID